MVNTATGAQLTYGSLAEAAAKLPAPTGITLKTAAQFKLIGTSPKRIDTPLKVNGTAGFGLDVRRPGMLYASLERCPVFEGKVASFDATKAMAVPGVKKVVEISNGVAVVADNTWSAMEGRKALVIKWDEGKWANVSTPGSAAGMGGVWPLSPACPCARQATPRAPSPAPRRKSKQCTKRRISRMLPWSR